MRVVSKAKNLQISPRKLRLAADLIRGKKVDEAKHLLVSTNKKSTDLVYDSLKSAVANASNNNDLRESKLTIDEIRVDEGRKLKRYKPRARGVAGKIFHRKSHLTIIVSDQEKKEDKPAKAQKTTEGQSDPKIKNKEDK